MPRSPGIDFTFGTPVPLSPWLAAIVAVALGLAALALLRRQSTPRMLLLGAAVIVASSVFVLPRTSNAKIALGLLTSPSLFPVNCASPGSETFYNALTQDITLTKVAISGPLGISIGGGGSCKAGATLAPNEFCDVVFNFPTSCNPQ